MRRTLAGMDIRSSVDGVTIPAVSVGAADNHFSTDRNPTF